MSGWACWAQLRAQPQLPPDLVQRVRPGGGQHALRRGDGGSDRLWLRKAWIALAALAVVLAFVCRQALRDAWAEAKRKKRFRF